MKRIPFRIGQGYDLHRLVEGRKLVLGGVEIEHSHGLLGHSDADCLIHALADSLFGALALPDIGHHFPDNDPACKDLDSKIILQKAALACKSEGYAIANLDLTLVAQEPKLSPYLERMKLNLSQILRIEPSQIGLKATTNESVGCVGRKEAIAAFSVCLLQRED
ncbi:MAG: 2-C-methyl-D-erythritol 2,4-cyclodiphosphate synthase [Opitutae bacterium]|jgi:2-C-methyl-D-erythritol 2,4-cyclodiphosphate synthase|nr:2-C-methyl-D-erythritol 2,4-cyclodiphosphate synthase [Opitutae bacterium]MEC8865725.1 2-C-methyl-D-erythritol 2,4-cyclodiphosphate synthase [Verrucomicrobiota bacterium]HAY74170.1 2-C-methyl-D-erythritol 2,4-cyclodiphosphate synthase [Opitutae bacterium]|tara:strand:- start:6305 stop:6796 length:492 start_codon:yes stop_codon:yes gene_type:complete